MHVQEGNVIVAEASKGLIKVDAKTRCVCVCVTHTYIHQWDVRAGGFLFLCSCLSDSRRSCVPSLNEHA